MSKVLCFGELLLRFSPQLNGSWIDQASMPVFVGGAELNTATALARWGIEASYGTALPDNYLAHEIVDEIRRRGVDPSPIRFSGDRVGTYYLPQGADLKAAGVIYDRAHSSFASLKPGQIDWPQVFAGVSWFHFSAISPALNQDAALVCAEALQEATRRGIFVSVDLNYRAKLWQYGVEPSDVLPALVDHCDLVMGNLWAVEKMLGIALPDLGDATTEDYVQAAGRSAAAVTAAFPKCKQVAYTFRFDRDGGIDYFASLYKHGHLYLSATHRAESIVDKVGSGDCFMGGLVYGNVSGLSAQETIDFAASAAVNKLFIKGDATTAGVEEIRKGYPSYA
ncbi:MAG: carbohydrate kinase [Flaviaesturariibacter sp.]|nr:carbohydrate kinase [Flaviaesturariibacter sp.]